MSSSRSDVVTPFVRPFVSPFVSPLIFLFSKMNLYFNFLHRLPYPLLTWHTLPHLITLPYLIRLSLHLSVRPFVCSLVTLFFFSPKWTFWALKTYKPYITLSKKTIKPIKPKNVPIHRIPLCPTKDLFLYKYMSVSHRLCISIWRYLV